MAFLKTTSQSSIWIQTGTKQKKHMELRLKCSMKKETFSRKRKMVWNGNGSINWKMMRADNLSQKSIPNRLKVKPILARFQKLAIRRRHRTSKIKPQELWQLELSKIRSEIIKIRKKTPIVPILLDLWKSKKWPRNRKKWMIWSTTWLTAKIL